MTKHDGALSGSYLFSCLAGASLLATAFAGFQPVAAQAQDESIRVGLVTPMAGANGRFGGFALRGMELAIKEVNSAGGANGQMLELSYAATASARRSKGSPPPGG